MGIQSFIEFVRDREDDDAVLPCPCHQCLNQHNKDLITIQDHLFINGMQCTYIRWVYHGEPYDQPGIIDPLFGADPPEDDHVEEDEEYCLAGMLGGLYNPYASKNLQGSRKKHFSLN